MLSMKTTTALVGVGAAALAGAAIYLVLRKPDEEKALPSGPSKLGPGSFPTGGGSGSGSTNRGDTTHAIADHSIDQIVDIIRGSASRGVQPEKTQTQQTVDPQLLEPTETDDQWTKAKEAGL